MLSEILRFFKAARALLEAPDPTLSLGEFLDRQHFGRAFQADHLLPMGAAIWSCPPTQMRAFPAVSFARFFANHGLLSLRDRPQWRVVTGGSKRYVDALCKPFRDQIRLETPVAAVRRSAQSVELDLVSGETEVFDAVVFACHSDEALALLADPTPEEKDVLGAIRYQRNEVALHTDSAFLPRSARARSAWNYHVPKDGADEVTVTYDMNTLQGIEAPVSFLLTLNRTGSIDPDEILGRYDYSHPIFDGAAIDAQKRRDTLGAEHRTAYCGAYWGFGFHEDGVCSGLVAAEDIERLAS
jgi:predicted NAD/FAD-binding protein